MASFKKKNHKAPSGSKSKGNVYRGLSKRVSALGQHMERVKNKKKKK